MASALLFLVVTAALWAHGGAEMQVGQDAVEITEHGTQVPITRDAPQDVEDSWRILFYFPVVGDVYLQTENFLHAVGFASALNRTLVVPWISTKTQASPLNVYNDLDPLQQMHPPGFIEMQDFVAMLEQLNGTTGHRWLPSIHVFESEGPTRDVAFIQPYVRYFALEVGSITPIGDGTWETWDAERVARYPPFAKAGPVLCLGLPYGRYKFASSPKGRPPGWLPATQDPGQYNKLLAGFLRGLRSSLQREARDLIERVPEQRFSVHIPRSAQTEECLQLGREEDVTCFNDSRAVLMKIQDVLSEKNYTKGVYLVTDNSAIAQAMSHDLPTLFFSPHKEYDPIRHCFINLLVSSYIAHYVGDRRTAFSNLVLRARGALAKDPLTTTIGDW